MDALRRYKPVKTDPDDGTFVEVLDEATAITMFGWIRVHAAEVTLIISKHEDVFPGSIIVVLEDEEAGPYRVVVGQAVPSSGFRSFKLERISKPIMQLAGGYDEGYDSGYE